MLREPTDGRVEPDGRYKWIALSNTTLGMLVATINSSIVIISLPAIFRGIHLDLAIVFVTALVMSLIAAGASWLRGGRYVHQELETPELPVEAAEREELPA